ncbi:MAG: carbamoyltransferase [Bacteriovoracaceae bacterium]|jgi:carbamoyltransferase
MSYDTSLKHSKQYLGLGKTLFNSSAAVVIGDSIDSNQILLTERLTQKKASGAWPELAISILENEYGPNYNVIAENRDVISPICFEEAINTTIPFFPYLKKKGLHHYTSHFNKNIKYITHHLSHAYAALAMSPYQSSIIIVMDGAGSGSVDFQNDYKSSNEQVSFPKNSHESCSIYLQTGPNLKLLKKDWQTFRKSQVPGHDFSEGIGMLYEKAAEYIFNNKRSAGKVMGLAGFGHAQNIIDPFNYLESLNWEHSFKVGSKEDWENSPFQSNYQDIAASVQITYENHLNKLIRDLKMEFPQIDNLILTGGTALNCTNNFKLLNSKVFNNIYIPPFPSDECISYGVSNYFFINENRDLWTPKDLSKQHGFLGSPNSIPKEDATLEVFKNYEIVCPVDIIDFTSELLVKGKVIGWFQGRSETGPRALGNRSILANVETPNLKSYLNESIKFREDFRPYGCSVLQEKASEYFSISKGFHNPYMSFAVPVRSIFQKRLKEVSHIDKTSRMQTVTEDFNSKFYSLLKSFGDKSGLYCLLNTSLNIMGKPIAETVLDAKTFLDSTNVDGIVIGNIYIKKN